MEMMMTEDVRQTGFLLILSSPSGAGKSTLARRMLERYPHMEFSVSATTRPPRSGEVDGREYHFLERAEFVKTAEAGGMLEHALVHGNLYGTPRAPVDAAIAAGREVVFDVDWQGGKQIRASDLADQLVSVFILPPSIAELEQRLLSRAQDAQDVVARRIKQAQIEIAHWSDYDYVLINDDLEKCTEELDAILRAERLRRSRRPGLAPHVAALDAEFAARS